MHVYVSRFNQHILNLEVISQRILNLEQVLDFVLTLAQKRE